MKKLWILFGLLCLSGSVLAQSLSGVVVSSSDSNIVFNVKTVLSEPVSGVNVTICLDEKMSVSCFSTSSNYLGRGSFLVPLQLSFPNLKQDTPSSDWLSKLLKDALAPVLNRNEVYSDAPGEGLGTVIDPLVLYYKASKEGFQPMSGRVIMRRCGGGAFCSDTRYSLSNVSVLINGFEMLFSWSDFFPACGKDKNQDLFRCSFDIISPNFHLSGIYSVVVKILGALFSPDLFLSDGNLSDRLIYLGFAVFGAVIMTILVFMFSMVLVYLEASLSYLAWAAAIDILIHENILNRQNYLVFLSVFGFVVIVFSFALLGLDIGVWRLF